MAAGHPGRPTARLPRPAQQQLFEAACRYRVGQSARRLRRRVGLPNAVRQPGRRANSGSWIKRL